MIMCVHNGRILWRVYTKVTLNTSISNIFVLNKTLYENENAYTVNINDLRPPLQMFVPPRILSTMFLVKIMVESRNLVYLPKKLDLRIIEETACHIRLKNYVDL